MNKPKKSKTDQLRGEMVTEKVSHLDLDPHNPRLPEELVGATQEELLQYLYDNGALEELAQSFADNGFFTHEPLIITPSATKGRCIVLEGNRRLAALMILQGRAEAQGLDFGIPLDSSRRDELRDVPCFKVKQREEVYTFLGFRHIGGIKKWGAEAKARYLADEVTRAAAAGVADPFREVGRRVGSNALGVRNSYLALEILRYAQEAFGINTRQLRNKRFGVWTRALNSEGIRTYIGFGEVTKYESVPAALGHLNAEHLARVISDLTPLDGGKALVEDSRDITHYGKILTNARASSMLAKHRDFELAKRVIEELDLPSRIRRIRDECNVLLQDVQQAQPSEDLLNAASELSTAARSLLGTIREALAEHE